MLKNSGSSALQEHGCQKSVFHDRQHLTQGIISGLLMLGLGAVLAHLSLVVPWSWHLVCASLLVLQTFMLRESMTCEVLMSCARYTESESSFARQRTHVLAADVV